ncbi:LuxR C-terminal-related transcriptional regulator [Kutzneria albida]|uniref:HTH luxR-type domain-containing protein n=1 Tax=Kutzneria albida DSM 43870 TaxID=1449976 RepID=W5WA59_9PSEU|nr:LuxR family transcriptional regulator [Kutzneria albida]AHH97431.1 hypothetical protein KALB_4067 [Kutzneria albida DSM 43870]
MNEEFSKRGETEGVHRPRGQSHGFVGRQHELRLLDQARRDSMTTGLVRYVVEGELGVGRTALLYAFALAARRLGSTTVHFHGSKQPCGLLVRALARSLPADSVHVAELHAASERQWGRHTALPNLDTALVSAVRAAIVHLTVTAPLILIMDHADQADDTALAHLRSVVEACADLPVLLVASLRLGEPPQAPAAVAQLLSGAQRLTLDGLSPAETAALLGILLPRLRDSAFSAACHRLTAGNPFMLVELARWVRDNGGAAVRPEHLDTAVLPVVADLITGRLSRIDPAAGRLIRAIAVAGGRDGAEPPLVAHLCGMTTGETLITADLLVRMRLVADDDMVRLRHPLLRTALIGGMSRMARNAAHLAAATFLHERHAPASRIADHLTASAVSLDDSWPASVLLDAAASALAAQDTTAAARCLEHAVRVATGDERREAVLALVDLRIRLDQGNGLAQAIEALAETADAATRSSLLRRIGSLLHGADRPEGEQRVLEAVAAAVAGTAVAEWPRLHRILADLHDAPPAVTAERLGELLEGPPGGLRAAATAAAAFCRHLTGDDPRAAVEGARGALACGTEELYLHPLALAAALTVLVDNGYQEEATAHLRRHTEPDSPGSQPLHQVLLLPVAVHHVRTRGQLSSARDQLEDCLAHLVRHGVSPVHPIRLDVVGQLLDVLICQGEHNRAKELLRQGRCAQNLPPGWRYRDLLVCRARLWAAEGDLARAARDLAELRDRNEAAGLRAVSAASWRAHGVELLEQVGQSEQAAELARDQLRYAETIGSPQERGRARWVLGRVSGGTEGERLLRTAVRLLEEAKGELDLAYALGDMGTLLNRLDRPKEAVAELTRAVRLASSCGARSLAERGRQQLAAASDRTHQDFSLRGVLTLSPRERQTLIDAMRGRTNERIAAARRITRRTVELHLSSAYRKLGITGRRDFPQLFRNPGLWPLLTDGVPDPR